jgi:threonine dehydrogenase-like Zn-dependent dehydrogenase
MMRQVRIHGVNDVRLEAVPRPVPGPRDAIIRMAACGICGSDLVFIRNGGTTRKAAGPMPLGHEGAGIVEAVGAEVEGIAPGLRVVIDPMAADLTNVIGTGGTEGMFADYLLVRDAALGGPLLQVPDAVPLAVAAVTEPLGVALHSVNRGNPQPGEKAAIFGAGPIGLGVLIWLKDRGIEDVVVIDLHPGRLARARALGASGVIQTGLQDIGPALMALQGTAHVRDRAVPATNVYFDCAGAPHLPAELVRLARRHARLVITAVYGAPVQMDFGRTFLRSELSITGAVGYPDELPDVVAALPRLGAALGLYVTGVVPFGQVIGGFELARQPDSAKVIVSMEGLTGLG